MLLLVLVDPILLLLAFAVDPTLPLVLVVGLILLLLAPAIAAPATAPLNLPFFATGGSAKFEDIEDPLLLEDEGLLLLFDEASIFTVVSLESPFAEVTVASRFFESFLDFFACARRATIFSYTEVISSCSVGFNGMMLSKENGFWHLL